MFFFKKASPVAFLVAGLGNLGPKYAGTRHNAGFMALDFIAAERGFRLIDAKFRALCGKFDYGNGAVLFIKPQTFMNDSGLAVREASAYYKLPPERVIIIYDDTALPVGKLRVRPSGSDGGHNGVKSVIEHLGTDAFPRIRIGIGERPHPGYDLADYVLSRFTGAEKKLIDAAVERASAALEEIIAGGGVASAMNKYN